MYIARVDGELRSSGLLRGEQWQLLTDVSGQRIGSHIQGSKNPEYGIDRLSLNVGNKLPLLPALWAG